MVLYSVLLLAGYLTCIRFTFYSLPSNDPQLSWAPASHLLNPARAAAAAAAAAAVGRLRGVESSVGVELAVQSHHLTHTCSQHTV